MKCPTCDERLVMTERQGIEIDYCPSCRGVWLEKGELDKIIERSAAAQGSPRDGGKGSAYDHPRDDYPRYPDRPRDWNSYGYGKKKKGFLGDLFDFD